MEQLPNSRLLYLKKTGDWLRWEESVHKIDSYIERSPRLQKSSSLIILNFQYPSQSEFFNAGEKWVGREIIGHPHQELNNQGLYFHDYGDEKIRSFEVEEKDFSKSALEALESKMRLETDGLADTWRLSLDTENGKMKVKMQFFML